MLLLGVDHPESARGLRQVADSAERLVQLVELPLLDEELFLGEAARGALEVELLELLHAGEALGDRREVGQQATEPALVHVGLADTRGLLGDRVLGLLLGAHEEDGAAVGDRLADEFVGLVDVGQRLLEIDDVAARTLGEDEALHLRVPPAGLVSEVDAAVEQLAHGYDGHLPYSCSGTPRFPRGCQSVFSDDRTAATPGARRASATAVSRDGPCGCDAALRSAHWARVVTPASGVLHEYYHPAEDGLFARLRCEVGSTRCCRPNS